MKTNGRRTSSQSRTSLPRFLIPLALVVGLMYVAIQQFLLFRAGSYYKLQKEKSKEVLAAMVKSPVFMLEEMEQRDAIGVDTQIIPRRRLWRTSAHVPVARASRGR